jgi:hypothetical protein
LYQDTRIFIKEENNESEVLEETMKGVGQGLLLSPVFYNI